VAKIFLGEHDKEDSNISTNYYHCLKEGSGFGEFNFAEYDTSYLYYSDESVLNYFKDLFNYNYYYLSNKKDSDFDYFKLGTGYLNYSNYNLTPNYFFYLLV
jgi:hypothetical protein